MTLRNWLRDCISPVYKNAAPTQDAVPTERAVKTRTAKVVLIFALLALFWHLLLSGTMIPIGPRCLDAACKQSVKVDLNRFTDYLEVQVPPNADGMHQGLSVAFDKLAAEPLAERKLNNVARQYFDVYAMLLPYRVVVTDQGKGLAGNSVLPPPRENESDQPSSAPALPASAETPVPATVKADAITAGKVQRGDLSTPEAQRLSSIETALSEVEESWVKRKSKDWYCEKPVPSDCRSDFLNAISYGPVILGPGGQEGLIVEVDIGCGNHFCSGFVLRKIDGGYENVFYGNSYFLTVTQTITNGYYDIVDGGSKYLWDGSKYVWDDSK
jgi:hypothetical protein